MPLPASWDGTFKFIDVGFNEWFATDINNSVSMSGPMLCNASLSVDGDHWLLLIGDTHGNFLWTGTTPPQLSPVGVYTRLGGNDATPATITIIGSNTPRTEITAPPSCFPS